MIRNYLVIALRNLQRQFSYSVINIVGLAIGLGCSAVISMYVFNEWSYDRHHPHADRIYRIGVNFFNIGGLAVGPEILAESLPRQYEGVEAFTQISKTPALILSTDTSEYRELAYYTDTSFFTLFPRKFLSGSGKTALKNDHSVVMTESMAQKIFGTVDVLGRSILIGMEKEAFVVTGVVEEDLRPSQLNAKVWLSIQGKLTRNRTYTSASLYNYVLLRQGQQRADLDAALDRILEKEVYPERMGVPTDISFADYKMHPNAVQFMVDAMKDLHLHSNLRFEISPGGNAQNIATFGAISLFVLLLAAVNFINLTTARASRRAREVGIRKAVGSSRGRLISQFLSESLLVSGIAMLLSLFFGEGLLLVFRLLSGSILIPTLWTPWNLGILVIFTIIIGLCSGIYPAFYLTAFQPVKVLKGNLSADGRGGFRNLLVIFQFAISLCLMMCTAVIIRQMNFMKARALGFSPQNIVAVDNLENLGTHVDAFEHYVSNLAGVSHTARHAGEPGNENSKTVNGFKTVGMPEPITINTYPIDDQMIPLMGFELIEGRNFNHQLASDTAAIIFNEAAVKAFGLKDPVGTKFEQGGTVVGVVRNYHWQSLREEIGPSAFVMGRNGFSELSIRISNAHAGEVIAQVIKKWKELAPTQPIQYHFLDENFGAYLDKERVFERAVGFFTVLAIFVSCLGLYGLSAYTTEQRNKEIGLRKVMGASGAHIVTMLNKRFAVLVAISALIATPLAAYMMTTWLEGFAYRTELDPGLFLVSIVAAFILAVATVSYHSIKASMTNPVEALKYE